MRIVPDRDLREMNSCHRPSGAGGGQFCSKPGGEGSGGGRASSKVSVVLGDGRRVTSDSLGALVKDVESAIAGRGASAVGARWTVSGHPEVTALSYNGRLWAGDREYKLSQAERDRASVDYSRYPKTLAGLRQAADDGLAEVPLANLAHDVAVALHLPSSGDAMRAARTQTTQDKQTEDIARAYASGLRKALGREKFAAVVRANDDDKNLDVDHSHDHIDANEVMAAAFRAHRADTDDADLWNRAWRVARKNRFWATYADLAYKTDGEERRADRAESAARGRRRR